MANSVIKKIQIKNATGETIATYDIGVNATNVDCVADEQDPSLEGKKLQKDLTSDLNRKALGHIYNIGYIYNDNIITEPTNIGEKTISFGANNITNGKYSFSIGTNIVNSYNGSGAIGNNLKTWGNNQLVVGELAFPLKADSFAESLKKYAFIVHSSKALWSPASLDYQSEAAFAVGGEEAVFQVPTTIKGSLTVTPLYQSYETRDYLKIDSDGVTIDAPLTLKDKIQGIAQADTFSGNLFASYNRYIHAGEQIDQTTRNEVIKTAKDVYIAGSTATTKQDTFYVQAKDGIVHASSTTISGLDYAEYLYPWHDNNIDNEDRVGYFVTVKNNLLYKANAEDSVLGVVSETYGILGTPDALDIWKNKYKKDKFGRIMLDAFENQILNDDYQEEKEYITRNKRQEWSAVGLIGQMYVRDDGTCIPGQYCKCNQEGIATLAEKQDFNTWFVLERIDTDVVKILFK